MLWISDPEGLFPARGSCLVHWECDRFCTPHRRKDHGPRKKKKGAPKKGCKIVLV